jgi:5-formyltetrahydrofolate cyclo-ligase
VDFPLANLRLAPSAFHLVNPKASVITDAPSELDAEKARIRADARAKRDALSSGLGAAAAVGVAARFMSNPELVALTGIGVVVSGYMPLGSEVDPQLLLRRIGARGSVTCLPDVASAVTPLVFRRWDAGDALETGAYGIQVPGQAAEPVSPTLLLVPLLAFDRGGHRLGYGGGFYDRTIAGLRGVREITTVGLAFSDQLRDDLPVGPHDMRLDWIVTESAALHVAG